MVTFGISLDKASSVVLNCVACLIDTEDSQTGENCSSQGVKEQRQRQEFAWHLRTGDRELVERFRELKALYNLQKYIQCANTHNYTNQWYTSVQNIRKGTNICIQNMAKTHAHNIARIHTHTHTHTHARTHARMHTHTHTHTHTRTHTAEKDMG